MSLTIFNQGEKWVMSVANTTVQREFINQGAMRIWAEAMQGGMESLTAVTGDTLLFYPLVTAEEAGPFLEEFVGATSTLVFENSVIFTAEVTLLEELADAGVELVAAIAAL